MAEETKLEIQRLAAGAAVPYLDEDLAAAGVPIGVETGPDGARISVALGFPAASVAESLAEDIRARVAREAGDAQAVAVEIKWEIRSHAVQGTLAPLPGVKNILAVASGKGGVGKSTTAANLALALVAEGARVGILDADVYGPSQPQMLGLAGARPVSKDRETFEPLEAYDLQTMSLGFLVDQDQAMIWRGPMVTQALSQLLFQTNWRDLDYLVIDLPPGTGDTQLTLTQQVPLSGALIVTTPQDIALLDARRGLKMFERVNVPVLGVIENMSSHICPECGHEDHIFGSGGGERLAVESGVRLLGQLPLDIRIRQEADGGTPTVIADPDGPIAARYRDIAGQAAAILSLQARDRKAAFPKIVVETPR
jgi:ATP-binding protein involved in chromosome partitioning